MTRTHTTTSEHETAAVGRELARRLGRGAIVLLSGSLGAGKTAFVRGLAEGLGCDPDAVSSPTFTIIQEYPGPVPLQHVDLYRLSPAEVDDLGLEDLFEDHVAAIEWSERWRRAPLDSVRVVIEILAGDGRSITISGPAQRR